MGMGVLSAYICVYHVFNWYPERPEKDVGFPGAGVTGDSNDGN